MNSIAPHVTLPAPLTAPGIAAHFQECQAAFIANMATELARLAALTGFAGRAQMIRQGFDPDDLDRWGLMAWCKAIEQGGPATPDSPRGKSIDPRMTDVCPTGILTGTPPFRLRQWVKHLETGRTGSVIAQQPHDTGRHQGTPLGQVWLVTIKTAAGPLSGPGTAFVGD